jgi:hypothetical protein
VELYPTVEINKEIFKNTRKSLEEIESYFSYGGIKNPPPFKGGDELIPTLLNMTP